MSQQKSGDGAKTSKYDDICPICGKNRKDNSYCRKEAELNLCPAKDEHCHNNHKKTIDGKEEIARKGCSSSNSGSKGNGIRLGYNILSGSDWAPGINAKEGAPVKLFKKRKYQHYLYTGSGSIEAHHLICSATMDDRWTKICEMTGYNINCRKNGVFFPADIQLACHTGLQRHRGNHNLGYGGIGMTYVDTIKNELEKILSSINDNETKPCDEYTTEDIVYELNELSNRIFKNIASFTWTIAWDSLTYNKDIPLGVIGCANSKNGEIDEKREYLQKTLRTELDSRNLDFNNIQFDDMQKLKEAKEDVLNTAKCDFDRNHQNTFSDIKSIGYILTIGH